MSEQEQIKCTKGSAIVLQVFFFMWSGLATTLLCHDLIHKHNVILAIILCIVWTVSFKFTNWIISKMAPISEYDGHEPDNFSNKITNDICTGIAPHGYWWNNNSTTTHTHDPYISSTTYTPTNRDY